MSKVKIAIQELKDFAVEKFKKEYGYCGVAEGETFVYLNTDDGKGNDIKIKIEVME